MRNVVDVPIVGKYGDVFLEELAGFPPRKESFVLTWWRTPV